jgi:hypothetical protein
VSRIESADSIEAKVGAKRHATEHRGRAVTVTERVYVLHSAECMASGIDLRRCEFSKALDLGIDLGVWAGHMDVPVVLGIAFAVGDLYPMRDVRFPAGTGSEREP